jgi:hypothetical protein
MPCHNILCNHCILYLLVYLYIYITVLILLLHFNTGTMLCSLLLSTTVRALQAQLAIMISGGLCAAWCIGVTLFWYYSVLPATTTSSTVADLSSSGVEDAATASSSGGGDGGGGGNLDGQQGRGGDCRLPVTLVTGFLGEWYLYRPYSVCTI